jgi:hypothetical protein
MLMRRRALAPASIFTVFLIVAWVISGSTSFKICFHENEHGETYASLYENINVISKAIIRIRLNGECGLRFFGDVSAAITALATIAIAWFTLSLRESTNKLWNAGERQLKQITASSEHQLRAYLYVDNKTPLIYMSGTLARPVISIRVRTKIKNFGQTPAYRIRNASYISFLPFPLGEGDVIASPVWDDPREMGSGPGEDFLHDVEWNGAYVQTPGIRPYIIDLVEYFDVFGRKKRTTKYCFSFDLDAFVRRNIGNARLVDGGLIDGGDVVFMIAPQHNEAD